MEKRLIVISDIHVGAAELDDCDGELEAKLTGFIDSISAGGPTELIINGDFLDFAQAPPWRGAALEARDATGLIDLCFTEAQSHEKLQAIRSDHSRVFSALTTFLTADAGNLLTVLPGNHDADFFWPSIRAAFAEFIADGKAVRDRIYFHLEQVYRPTAYPAVWIEHGHQYDPCNCFIVGGKPLWSSASPPIMKDHTGVERLYECIGTRFLIRFINQLDAEYPFVDNIKPFSRFLRIFGASSLVHGYGPLKALIAVREMLRYLAVSVTYNPKDLLGLEEASEFNIKVLIEQMPAASRAKLSAALKERGFERDQSEPLDMYMARAANAEKFMNFLGENLDMLDAVPSGPGKDPSMLAIGGQEGKLTLARQFSVDETSRLRKAAEKILKEPDVKAVVMGHTHDPVDPRMDLNYINTGSWTRYYEFVKDDRLTSWDVLRRNAGARFPYALRYAEISPGTDPSVRVRQYDA